MRAVELVEGERTAVPGADAAAAVRRREVRAVARRKAGARVAARRKAAALRKRVARVEALPRAVGRAAEASRAGRLLHWAAGAHQLARVGVHN